MEKKYKIKRMNDHWICLVKVPVVVFRLLGYEKFVMKFKPLNKLGTILLKSLRSDDKRPAYNLKTFKNKWDAQAWLNKIKKRVENRI